jgi:hypothetical protein
MLARWPFDLETGLARARCSAASILIYLAFFFFFLYPSIACRQEKGEASSMKKGRSQPYFCLWETEISPVVAEEGEIISLNLKLVNAGRRPWKSSGPAPCFLSYHLLDNKEKMLRRDNPRFALPREIKPGEKIEMKVTFPAPLIPGKYFLDFDLVLEGKAWFESYGSKTLRLPLLVKSVSFPEDKRKPELEMSPFTLYQTTWPEINQIAKLIRLTLRHGEIKFRGKTGEVAGFRAGTGYPQIWIRDAATILPASCLFYPEPFLVSWLEEILSYQDKSGSIPDWIEATGRTDKNTTESDQESSAVQAASFLVRLMGEERGREWLGKEIEGQKIIERLEKALNYLFDHRYDPHFRLITGAHTADWGDVEAHEGDERAIYADSSSQWTVDLYDQSMAYQACLDLASLLHLVREEKKSAFWKQRANQIKNRTNALLWQENRGFYRVHRHVTPLTHDFDEDDIFALGGHTLAILSGLADPEKAGRIIEEALNRQQRFGLSTISGCLLPPYPAGFFRHPMMDEPYEYQNGGQWDWFGGRFVAAMYESGYSQEATRCLLEIVRKNLGRGCFYEWDTREGYGQGSLNYAGSAGALAMAIYQGLLGFKVNRERPEISPRLGSNEARAQIYFPVNGLFYAYDYQVEASTRKIKFTFNSNDSRQGLIRLLWPWGKNDQPEVKLDGQPIACKRQILGHDLYLEIKTDLRFHRLEISP